MQNRSSYCSNCGAPMEQDRFSLVCKYCGSVFTGNSSKTSKQEQTDVGKPRKHYDYIVTNEERISQSGFVELKKEGKRYLITSTPFYSNDGFLKQIPSPYWQLQFQCDGRTERILIGVSGKRPASRMEIKIGDGKNVLALQKAHISEEYTWFILSEEQLLSICTTQKIDLSTDIPIPSEAQFNELPIFASRLYNIAFNRMKFMYSTHTKLITD